MEAWIGRVLSKVRIERLIGRGGMADVYLGRHTTLNRPMAIKILHAHMTLDSDLRRRFRDEAQAVAALRHPNIVQVIDFDVIDDRPYIVMELLEGMALNDYLSSLHSLGHSLPLETVGRLMNSLTGALGYAHQRGIVHRDVKPANIILRQGQQPIDPSASLALDVEPVLTDFGVARIATSTTPTASGTILGTPAYMSPEQVKGEPVDARSDIYSLGVILYEILAGQLPFNPKSDTPAAILYKHVHEAPPPLIGVSSGLRKVVDTALAKAPVERYSRAGELADELQSAIRAMPSAEAQELRHTQVVLDAAQATTPWAGGRPIGRTAMVAVGGVLAVAVLVAGTVLGGRMVRQAGQPTQTAAPRSSAAVGAGLTPGTGLATATAALVSEPAAQPSQTDASASDDPIASATANSVQALGYAFVRDSSLELRLRSVPPPQDGYAYQVWLIPAGQAQPLNLNRDGKVDLIGGELDVSYSDPEALDLIGPYQGMVISLERTGALLTGPTHALFQGQLESMTLGYAQLEIEVKGDGTLTGQLPALMDAQATHFESHANLALNAINGQNLADAKSHSEHVVNIIEGRQGEFYGDWDLDGQIVNPGDPVGLLPYLQLLQAMAQGAQQAEIERGRSGEDAASIAARAQQLVNQLVELREAARQISRADTIDVVRQTGLDVRLSAAQELKAQIDQLSADAEQLDLVFAIQLSAP